MMERIQSLSVDRAETYMVGSRRCGTIPEHIYTVMAKNTQTSSRKRFKALVHYVCDQCSDPTKLGATKLNKALWYSDTLAYRVLGKSISGDATYVKRQYGPVPKQILETLDSLQREGALKIRETTYHGKPKREYISLEDADVKAFSKEEREIIDDVIRQVCHEHTAASISNLSHNVIWDAADLGEEIPMFAVLAARAEPVTKADRSWAEKAIREHRAAVRKAA